MKTEAEIKARMESLNESDWPTATELLEWVLEPSPVVHEGKDLKRTEYVFPGTRKNPEKVFMEHWKEENGNRPGRNSGRGTLEHLLCTERSEGQWGWDSKFVRGLTQEEATAAASAIQWLGTNCGWCWLENVIRECGFDLVMRREKK